MQGAQEEKKGSRIGAERQQGTEGEKGNEGHKQGKIRKKGGNCLLF